MGTNLGVFPFDVIVWVYQNKLIIAGAIAQTEMENKGNDVNPLETQQKADEALMFDIKGNIATNNSTHFFYVKNNCVYTSTGKYCVKGITRQKVIDLCKKNKIKVKEMDFKLKDVLAADESFVTGTFANIIPVKKINSTNFSLKNNKVTHKLRELYIELMEK